MQTNIATNILLIKSVRFPRRNIFYTSYHTYQLQELMLLIPYSCTFQFRKKLCTPLLITREGIGGKTYMELNNYLYCSNKYLLNYIQCND